MNKQCWYYCEDVDGEELCIRERDESWCDEHCPIYKSMKASFEYSNLPKKYWYPFSLRSVPADVKTIESITEIRNNLDEFVNKGKNVLLQSSKCGNGKTSWGIKLLQKSIELHSKCSINGIVPAYFVYIPDLLLEARKSISSNNSNFNRMITLIKCANLVMFDDIGCVPLKDYDLIILSSLIEHRMATEKSCIFTTNFVDEVLKTNLGERLFDRIYRTSVVITFKADSLRGVND